MSSLGSTLLVRLRVPFGFLFAIAYFWLARPLSWTAFGAACGLVVIGCALRSWAAGYLLKGKRVAVGGPYAWVRNPLYVGSFILGLGFCSVLIQPGMSAWSIAFCAAYGIGYGVVYPVKVRAEERELALSLGDDYRRYASRVPRFLPVHGYVRGLGIQHFSGELYRRNREYQCVLGSLAAIVFLGLRLALGF